MNHVKSFLLFSFLGEEVILLFSLLSQDLVSRPSFFYCCSSQLEKGTHLFYSLIIFFQTLLEPILGKVNI